MPVPYQLGPARLRWEGTTPLSCDYEDIYWHPGKAVEEKSFVFVDAFVRQVEGAAGSNSRVCCVELGFGFGINCLLTCGYWQESRPAARLDYISIEKHPVPRQELSRLLSGLKLPLANTLVDNWPVPLAGMHVIWLTRNIRLLLILEDVHHALAGLEARVDAWYLDGFSPASNAAMWADNLYRRMFTRSAPGARVTTYTAAGRVRRGLGAAGFHVRKVKGFGGKHEMLVAERPGNWTPGTLDPRRVAIIGGGLAGHFCAEAFARRGLNPTLVDNGRVNPSQVPQLAVFPQLAVRPEPRYRFSLLAHQYMLPCPGFEATGVAFFPRNADEVGRLQRIAAQFSSNFIEWRGSHLWFESGGWWSLGSFLQPTVFETIMADISSIRHRDQGWRLYTGAREVTRADVVILATGPDRRLAGKEPEIRSVRGQAISLATEGIACVTTGPVSIFPTANGRSTIAGTYSRHTQGTDMQASADDTAWLLAAAGNRIPITGRDIRTHVGLRSASRDRLPIVDLAPNREDPGLYLCTAFASRGATHARLCGEHLASRILGEASPLSSSHRKMLSATRFRQRTGPPASP